MPTIAPTQLPSALDAALATASITPEGLNDRLAEAARYAVLRRLMPVLRHDVAGAMQPIRMLLMVLERRVQLPEPDLQAIAKNVTSLSSLTKDATADFINALEWIASSQDNRASLRSSADEAIKLLAIELSANGLRLVNGITDDMASAPKSFLRSVFMGALLALCDQSSPGSTLRVTFDAATNQHPIGRLQLRMTPGDSGSTPTALDVVRKYRLIDWPDVEAMARSLGVTVERVDGCVTLDLPGD